MAVVVAVVVAAYLVTKMEHSTIMRQLKILVSVIVLCNINSTLASSSTNTKQYCDPTELNKYNPSPVDFSDKTLTEITDSFESAIIKGNSADTVTKDYNNSPHEIFTLTSQVVTNLIRNLANKNDSMMNTSTVIGVAMKPDTIVYNRSDIVSNIINNLTKPVAGDIPSNGALIFSGSTSATSTNNNSNALQESYNTQNTTNLIGQLNYNDLVNNYLCGKNPAYPLSSTGNTVDITQIMINATAIELELNGCNDTMASSSDSSSSSSSDSTTSQAMNSMPATGASSNLIKESLQKCTAPIGGCELLYVQNTLVPQINGYLQNQLKQNPEFASTYNSIQENINNINSVDLSAYAPSTGMVCPSNALEASCSGSTCAGASQVQSSIQAMSSYLKTLNKSLKKLVSLKINTMIDQCEQTKQNTNTSDQKYFMNPGITFSEIVDMNSFGTLNTNSSMQCSTKNQYQTQTLAAISEDFIQKISDSVKTPELLSPAIPFGDDVVAQGGSFGNLNNQNNFSNYSKTIPTIANSRTKARLEVVEAANIYNSLVRTMSAQKSLPLQNLRYIVKQRALAFPVPKVLNKNEYINRCHNGLNSTETNSDCVFTNPYKNISTSWNLTEGQICSAAELEDMQASWRVKPGPNNTISPWQQKIQFSSATEVERAKVFLLAEIKEQNYINQQLKQRIMATKAVNSLTSFVESKQKIFNIIENIKQNRKNFIEGS